MIVYKGYKIGLVETTGAFQLLVDDEVFYENESLNAVKRKVDGLKKKVFKRIPGYISSGYSDYGEFKEIEITSVNSKGRVWIIDKNKNRSITWRSDNFYAYTKENLLILEEILKSGKHRNYLKKQEGVLEKKLKIVDLTKFKDNE